MSALDTFLGGRRLLHRLATSYDPALVDRIPDGFRNSLHWNVAHVLVTQQLLCYKLAGLPLRVDAALVASCSKGGSPEGWTPPPYEETCAQILPLAEAFADDYRAGRFASYTPYETSAGVPLRSIDDALAFLALHEGIHIGYCMALRRALSTPAPA